MTRAFARFTPFNLLLALTIASTLAAPAAAREVPFAAADTIDGLDHGEIVIPADLDNDGDLDLVVETGNDDKIQWYEWDTSVSPPVQNYHSIFNSAETIFDLGVADLDRDGDLDVVYAVDEGNNVYLSWRKNDGTPANDELWDVEVIEWWDGILYDIDATDLLVGDLDGDGDPDVVLGYSEAWEPSAILWLENDGTPQNGGWSQHDLEGLHDDHLYELLDLGDIDGDGHLDLLAWDEDQATDDNVLYWYRNPGATVEDEWPRYAIAGPFSSNWPGGGLADLDRDGDLDALRGGSWYRNDGTPMGANWEFFTLGGFAISEARVADLDADGFPDVLGVVLGGLGWFAYDGTPDYWEWTLINGTTPDEIATADLDRDGDLDIAASDQSNDRLDWYENLTIHRSAKLLDERVVTSFADGAYDVDAADLDGDGNLDLLIGSAFDNQVAWYRNDGSPGDGGWTFYEAGTADNIRGVAAGDLDGDGDLDLVSASYDDNTVAWYENDGTPTSNWVKRLINNTAGGASDVVLGDFDRDGDLDVACAQYLDDQITWYRNNGASPPGWTSFFVDSTPYDGLYALAAGDIDGDGYLDLAAASLEGSAVVWYSGDATPTDEWSPHRTDNSDLLQAAALALSDLDRDGDLDIIVAAYESDAVYWYENDGTFAGWTQRAVSPFCDGARAVAPGDFDLDGDPDVLFACRRDNVVYIATSNGGSPPSFSSASIPSLSAGGVRAVVAADLDRDGDLDGISGQGDDDQIAWYENGGGQFRVTGLDIAPTFLSNPGAQGVLRAVVTHRGRTGDGQEELTAVAVKLEEAPGDPLNAFQAASLIDKVYLYGDDGDGVFEQDISLLAAMVDPAGIDAYGVVWLSLVDGETSIPALASETFFVALGLNDPILDLAPETLVVTLLTDGASVCEGEDRTYDIPLTLEWRANVATEIMTVCTIFCDDFESNGTGQWSETFP